MITKKKLIREVKELRGEVKYLRQKIDRFEIDGRRVVASVDHPGFPLDVFYRDEGIERCGKVNFQELAEFIIDGAPITRTKQTVIFPGDGGEQKE